MITVQLLGGATLRSGDMPITGPPAQRHRIALLTLVVAAWPQPLARDRAMALLWPERDTANARRLLPDGSYKRVKPPKGEPPFDVQQWFARQAPELLDEIVSEPIQPISLPGSV